MPGEVSQEIGRAYAFVFAGCLERAVKGFQHQFSVYNAPDKLTFKGPSGNEYSFDLSGWYRDQACEVFVESKGYRDGSTLLDAYKEFLAKAYATSVQFSRHRRDQFWFVTNVPFGSKLGRKLWDPEFIENSLATPRTAGCATILGDAPLDRKHVASLSDRVAVGIFTDSFIRIMGTQYTFRPGDTLWSVTKLLHGGRIPLSSFGPIENSFRAMNNMADPSRVRSGKRMHLPWYGIFDRES